MKRGMLITSIVTGLLAVIALFAFMERSSAASETSAALEMIDKGLDWDGETPISMEEQTDRMNANLDIWRSQKSQRNTRGGLAVLLLAAAVGSAVMWKRQPA